MGRLGELVKLPAIDEGLKDILLDVGAVVVDSLRACRATPAGSRRPCSPVVDHIVGRRRGAQDQVIAQYCLVKPFR
jgi:hypothetical protein